MTDQSNSNDSGSKSDIVSDLMEINQLQYSIGRSLSVCLSSNYVYEPLNISGVASGAGRTIQRTLNTGSSFVRGDKSYLVMKVIFKQTSTATGLPLVQTPRAGATAASNYAHFGKGSILNIIDEVVLRTKDGVEIHTDRHADELNNILLHYENSKDWLTKSGSAMGHVTGLAPHGSDSNDQAGNGDFSQEEIGTFLESGFHYCIPMSAISRLFAYDRLLPSQLMSGLSISIKFKNVADAFTYVGSTTNKAFDYEVSDAFIRVATCDLADSMQSKIATMSEGKGGLKLLIDDFHYERQQITNTANVNVRANIAQATQMIVKATKEDRYNDITKDVYSAAGANTNRYSFRHGSTQYPKTEVATDSESYQQTMNSFNKNHGKNDAGSVSYNDWFTRGRVVSYDWSRGDLELSGVALSNAKTLSYNATYDNSDDKYVDTWVRHSKLLSVFLNNSVIES